VVVYVSEGKDESAQTPYQTSVICAGLAAPDDDAIAVGDSSLAGIAAKATLGTLPLFCAEVGPAPKPARLSTRYPHVFIARIVGDAGVALDAVMLALAPVISLFPVLVFAVSV
jgi:hypothetical protein